MQMKLMTYDCSWHDMDRDSRIVAIRQVHQVVFGQVMAITHSMMDLGVTKHQTREFLYRMCVTHQLEEDQRIQLLTYLHNQTRTA